MIEWNCTKDEYTTIAKIARRAHAIAEEHGPDEIDPVDHASLTMDLAAAHSNGCPLDFDRLLTAPDGDFGHDVFGIRKFIDRETGQLTDCFVPRCAMRDTATA